MRFLYILLVFTLFSGVLSAQERPLPTMDEVTKKLDDLYRSKSSTSVVKMEIINDRGKRTLTLEQWTEGEDNALIVIRDPVREAGTATLKTSEGLWNYAPRADRMIRVPSGLLADAWMGSHFTNDDLVRESSYEKDFDSTLAWVEEGGRTLLKAVMIPKKGAAVTFERLEYFLLPDTFTPVRADFYDKGKIYRRMEFKDVRLVGTRPIPFIMELTPMDKPNERTTMTYERVEFDVPVSKDTFTPQGLRRAAKRR